MKKNSIFDILVVLLICILMGVVIYWLTASVLERETIKVKIETERILLDVYLSSKQHATDSLNESGVEGIAVYGEDGRVLFQYGTIPEFEDIIITKHSDKNSHVIARGNKIDYISFPKGYRDRENFAHDVGYQGRRGDFVYNILSMIGIVQKEPEETGLPIEIDRPKQTIFVRRVAEEYTATVRFLKILQACSISGLFIIAFVIIRYNRKNKALRDNIIRLNTEATMGEAVRTLAHEIKNPLSTIMIQLAILKKTNPDNIDDYEIIENEATRLKSLADKTTGFLSNTLGSPSDIPLIEFLKGFYSRFNYPIVISVGSESENVTVFFDEIRLRSVVENLIKNAVESMEGIEGEEKHPVKIDVSLYKKNQVRLQVLDRGVGLPENSKKNEIFNPFYTTKIHGSGIGLAICRRFVEAAGGTISLYPRQNGGTVAEVILKRGNT